MKKLIILLALSIIFANACSSKNNKENQETTIESQNSLYDFIVKDIDGKDFDMATLKGKKVLIVNVASKCGLTPQYEQLEALYQKYKDNNFTILGFPSDNFKGQEFDSNEEIKSFCTLNYGVTFPIMSRVDVIGEKQIPLFRWLTHQTENGKMDIEVQWNFQKFMIDENGKLIDFLSPRELPDTQKLINWIESK